MNKYVRTRRMLYVVLGIVAATISTLPLQAQDLLCLGSCGIPSQSQLNSLYCSQRRAYCNNPSRNNPSPSQTQFYGAIAYSLSTNKVGYSQKYWTAEEAERMAVYYCLRKTGGARDCKSEVSFVNGCGALAFGDDDVVRWGRNEIKSVAEESALSSCRRNDGVNCELIFSHCSPCDAGDVAAGTC